MSTTVLQIRGGRSDPPCLGSAFSRHSVELSSTDTNIDEFERGIAIGHTYVDIWDSGTIAAS